MAYSKLESYALLCKSLLYFGDVQLVHVVFPECGSELFVVKGGGIHWLAVKLFADKHEAAFFEPDSAFAFFYRKTAGFYFVFVAAAFASAVVELLAVFLVHYADRELFACVYKFFSEARRADINCTDFFAPHNA